MCVCNPKTLVKYDELPKINGVAIEGIYAMKHDIDGFYRNRDAYSNETPDYYLCSPYFFRDEKVLIKTLPKKIAAIFGIQEYEGKRVNITNLHYRTRDSANGSFVDETMSIGGNTVSGGNSHSFEVYRGMDNHGINIDSELAKKMLNTLKINVNIEPCKIWEYTFDPCTHLRNEGGLNYPDHACSGWRRWGEMPYVTYDNGEHIRVLYEPLKAHVYLEKVIPQKGDTGLIKVSFNSSYEDNHNIFCFISHWKENVKDAANEMIRWQIDGFSRDKRTIRATPLINDEPKSKERIEEFNGRSQWYKIMRYVPIL